jgi:hypothetical protein
MPDIKISLELQLFIDGKNLFSPFKYDQGWRDKKMASIPKTIY